MEDFKINRDKPDMTDKQIQKHKNFDAVMKSAAVTNVPWYKMGKLWLTVGTFVGAFVITTLVITYLKEKVKPVDKTTDEKVEVSDDKLIEDNKADSTFFNENILKTIHVEREGVISTPMGITVEVPGGVILSESGVDKDEYDVKLTSFELPTDVEFPSYSKIECFQIDLSSAGEAVNLYGADALMIEDENVTIYESTKNGWEVLKEVGYSNEVIVVDSSSELLKPVQNTKRPFVFDKSYGVKEKVIDYYEIADYENLVFQPVVEQEESFYNKVWNDVFITQEEPGRYKLRLIQEESEHVIFAEVVFLKQDLDKALESYKNSFQMEKYNTVKEGHFHVLQNGGKYIVLYP